MQVAFGTEGLHLPEHQGLDGVGLAKQSQLAYINSSDNSQNNTPRNYKTTDKF